MVNNFFSVIIPVYKAEKYLRQTIESVLNQSYKKYEIILVDDGSPDGCPLLCDECSKKYNHVKVLHQENSGVSVARNNGISLAQGNIICFLDADDLWQSNFLEEMNELYNLFPEIGSASTGFRFFSKDGEMSNVLMSDKNKYLVFDDLLKNILYSRTSTYSIRTELLKIVGGFKEGVKRGEDIDLMLRAFCYAKQGFVNEILVSYRVDSEFNSTNAAGNSYFPFEEFFNYNYPIKSTQIVYVTGLIRIKIRALFRDGAFREALILSLKIPLFQYLYYKIQILFKKIFNV